MADPLSIPTRTTSLQTDETTRDSRKRRRKALKSSIESLNAHLDPSTWFQLNDEMIEIDMDSLDDRFNIMHAMMRDGLISKERFDKVVEDYLRDTKALKESKELFRTKQVSILEGLGEAAKGPPDVELAFCSLLLEAYEKNDRPSSLQSPFRRDLIDSYKSLSVDEAGNETFWCPISSRYYELENSVAAHVFPWFFGSTVMSLVFGKESAQELFSSRNGIIISKTIESKFDKHLVVIVPAPDQTTEQPITRWIFRVVDKSILRRWVVINQLTFEDIDGKELEFLSDARPAARYLYFHYVIALLRARKYNRGSGWLLEEAARKQYVWATPGKYIRENMLKLLASAVEHDLVPEVIATFKPHTILDKESGQDTLEENTIMQEAAKLIADVLE
ncbi:MAG: hypothetical protein M1829_000362 [Trizodia sp. TS-e1964]|nr:MAG: hypothetical protein M1829_000362 [Trizodia sp. TS-e1964]